MPVEFLSAEQRQGYGRYPGEPTPEQLARFFHLDDADHELIALRRGDHHRLGFAVQLCTARFLGTFLDEVREAPAGVVFHLARQLGLLGATVDLGLYGASNHRWEHRAEIRRRGGYREFAADPAARFALSRCSTLCAGRAPSGPACSSSGRRRGCGRFYCPASRCWNA